MFCSSARHTVDGSRRRSAFAARTGFPGWCCPVRGIKVGDRETRDYADFLAVDDLTRGALEFADPGVSDNGFHIQQ
jgi:hypothetical protein